MALNGAGKSTTQKILTGLLPLQKGQASVVGQDVRSYGRGLLNRIGVQLENPNLYRRLTGLENLAFHASLLDVPTADPFGLLRRVGLDDAAGRPTPGGSPICADRLDGSHRLFTGRRANQARDGIYQPARRAGGVSTPMEQSTRVRPYRPGDRGDRDAIARIFEQTGLFGEPVARYFPRDAFIADAAIRYYLRFESDWVLVAESSDSGQVVGYILGCPETARRSRHAVAWLVPTLAASMVRNGLLADRATWLLIVRGLREQIRRGLGRTAQPDLGPYPAHLHMGVAPDDQRRGAGRALLEAMLDRLRGAGAPGVHLETTNRHQAALALYAKAGFRELARERTRLFDHLLPPEMLPVERVVMGLLLADDRAPRGLTAPAPRAP